MGDTFQRLSETDAVARITTTIQRAKVGEAPFALVLGAGFSQGLVSTTRELVTGTLPLWIKAQEDGEPYDVLLKRHNGNEPEQRRMASRFWKGFRERNLKHGLMLSLTEEGLPQDNAAAYQAAFDPRFDGAAGSPADARMFQRELMRLDQPRLNAAHFLLGSILGVQPGKTRPSALFKSRAAFTRLILTTNFDPFLQTALQSVNRLYLMNDTPDLGLGDEIFDESAEVIQLVYVHGSIHRRSQKATEAEIATLKSRNARVLAPVLKRHGVIVLGYSGWDDTIVEALAACDSFDHRLFWCGLRPDPLVKGAVGQRVPGVLEKPSAFYVQISSAGQFMAQLCRSLIKGLPRLLENPVGQLREMLDTIDLGDLTSLRPASASGPEAESTDLPEDHQSFERAKKDVINRLLEAEKRFFGDTSISSDKLSARTDNGAPLSLEARSLSLAFDFGHVLAMANVAGKLGNFDDVIRLTNDALGRSSLEPNQRAQLLRLRAMAHDRRGDTDRAIETWSSILEVRGANAEWHARALVNRGIAEGKKGETDKAIADYTRVIEALPGAPVDQIARALVNRGVRWTKRGDTDRAIADYTRVIEALPGAPVDDLARALVNRGIAWGKKGEAANQIADYTQVIEALSGAPVDQIAHALVNRGIQWRKKGDADKAIADYTRVIEALPGAPVDDLARALINRGFAWGKKGEAENEIADYTRVIEALPGAPVDDLARALVNRGIAWGKKGEAENEIADYTRVIEALPGAPVDDLVRALVSRGIAWVKKGEAESAIADYGRVIEALPGAPVEEMAQALVNRGAEWVKKGEAEKAIADYSCVIEALPGAPVEEMAQALVNRGIAWGKKGEAENEVADYTRVIEALPGAPADDLACALVNRGVAWMEKGEAEKAIADYSRVIEALPGAPAIQIAAALAGRGWSFYRAQNQPRFLADTQASLGKLPSSGVAAFNLGLALLANGRDDEALAAHRAAALAFPTMIDEALSDLQHALGEWLTDERARPVRQLLESLQPRSSPGAAAGERAHQS
jgi:tetratricopeptide (TPR) repeat protein